MDEAELVKSAQHRDDLGHGVVHMPRAERAPDRNDQRLVCRETQLLFRRVLRVARERAANGRTGDDYALLLLIILFAVLKAKHYPVHMPRELLCREAGDGIALMHSGRNMQLGRRHEHRVADIAASADNGVGLEIADYLLRLMRGNCDVFQRLKIVHHCAETVPAAYVGYLQGLYLIALSRHELHFHLALGADEQHLAVRHQLAQPAGYRQRRIYMTGSAAAGEYKLHINTSLRILSFYFSMTSRDALRMIPISPSWMSSAVPP